MKAALDIILILVGFAFAASCNSESPKFPDGESQTRVEPVEVEKPGEFSARLPADWNKSEIGQNSPLVYEKHTAGCYMQIAISKHGESQSSHLTQEAFLAAAGLPSYEFSGTLTVDGHSATRWNRTYSRQRPSQVDDGLQRPEYHHDQEVIIINLEDGFLVLDFDVETPPFFERPENGPDHRDWNRFLDSLRLNFGNHS
jgi:hypothetical protein